MRRVGRWVTGLLLLLGSAGLRAPAAGAQEDGFSLTLAPLRYVVVDGDEAKFRAHHWMQEGYSGGVKSFQGQVTLPDGTQFTSEGHALIDQNDLGTELSLAKDALGFVNLDFQEFRKYYDGTGGVYYPFPTLRVVESSRNLALDIGKLELETGLTVEGWPELELQYAREYKTGAKSRLTWATVTDGGTTKNIAPSWQEVDEVVDAVDLHVSQDVAGFALTGEQRWEFVRSETARWEQLFSTAGVGDADSKIRRQEQNPQSVLLTTTLGAERRFWNDKAFLSSGYHFAHLKSREYETIIETNASGLITNFSRAENKIDARSDSGYDSHAWVGNLTTQLGEQLTLGTKLKAEVIKASGNSSYPAYAESSATPEAFDTVVDHTENSLSRTKAVRWGEALSVHFTGVPRTALYAELELEQSRALLREDRQSLDGPDTGNDATANEVFNRETVALVRRGTWTLGGRWSPGALVDLTAHVRHRVNENDYDDQRESLASGTALSAFIDAQNIYTNELATRLTVRPSRWLRSSLRYQLRTDRYDTRFEAQGNASKASLRSNIYTADVTLQPSAQWLGTASFSRQTIVTVTPAAGAASANTPAFHGDVNTWLLSANYLPRPSVTLSTTLQYSRAANLNDLAATGTGLPLGADFRQLDLTTGLTWNVTDRASVSAQYSCYHYNPAENVDIGDYTAHLIWLEVSRTF